MAQEEQNVQPSPHLLLVGEKASKRLLEVYVKRSLSLNDGTQASRRQARQTHKWVTVAEKDKRERRHSSDTSLHLQSLESGEAAGKDDAFSESEAGKKAQKPEEGLKSKTKLWKKKSTLSRNDGSSASCKSDGKPRKRLLAFEKEKRDSRHAGKPSKQDSDGIKDALSKDISGRDHLESSTETKKSKDTKKSKKSSIWKSVLEWFTRGHSEVDGDNERTEEAVSLPEPSTPPASCLPLPDVLSGGDRTRSKKRRAQWSFKRRSREMGFDKATGRPLTLDLSTNANQTTVKGVEEVEPTPSYYEKVSEELQKIVHEVKNSPLEEKKTFPHAVQPTDMNCSTMSQEEVVERIIALIKYQGDVIDAKLKENPTVSSYFSKLSYGSFQNLADQYVVSEVPQQENQPPVAASELVKFAFTLDFTARVASLSRHTPGHIVGFGNQYLKDRFTYMSESHLYIDDNIKQKKKKSKESSKR